MWLVQCILPGEISNHYSQIITKVILFEVGLCGKKGKIIQDGLSSGFSIVFTANLHSVVMFNPLPGLI